eukprot:1117776-Pelagomonas_calceolata.AAC.9
MAAITTCWLNLWQLQNCACVTRGANAICTIWSSKARPRWRWQQACFTKGSCSQAQARGLSESRILQWHQRWRNMPV